MELKEILKSLRKYKRTLIFSAVIGIVAGYLFYLLPNIYYATGSFYIKRAVDTTRFNYFSYEGYYAQQTGLSYTNTMLALFESTDVRYQALSNINLPTDVINFRKYAGMIKVKKSGPQLITLTVKGKTEGKAVDLWNSVANTVFNKNSQINVNGDPLLSISKVSDIPVITTQYKPVWACVIFGFVLIPILVLFYISLKEYFKWK